MTTPRSHTVLYARQPIYDRQRELAGFELLFRDRSGQNSVPAVFDGDLATSQVLVSAFTETDIEEVCEKKPVFVNFTANTLKGDIPFSPDTLVVEVLESVEPTAGVVASLVALRNEGYRIALDDYDLKDASHPLLPLADIVKLEYPAFTPDELIQVVTRLKLYNRKLLVLAEKIETYEDFKHCRVAGCDLFQGYFLARPQPVHGRQIPTNRLIVLQLISVLNDPYCGARETTKIVRNDPFLSVRLLQLANSAFYRRESEVTSLHAAVLVLGARRIRSLASLIALAKFDDKPHALRKLALTRGYFCQELAAKRLPDGYEMGFLVGMFSCLDAFFDQPLEEILKTMPLHIHIRSALLSYQGDLGLILHTVLQHEHNRWDDIRWEKLAELGFGPEQIIESFERGLAIANDQL
ncbi:EAL and HDOD domain-containing protein [Phytohalomonas tamaricis]|uniref:EAL and HDOD domain-containing protein n=1 Tax=Phytohalomonas tamaricis TaxID=2081032 RepID=UPI000D0B850A|nr:HDOD domain-containing protein [Phytohalomonas tamaricis]